MVTLLHNCLKIRATTNDDAADVRPIVRDKVLNGEFAALDNVQMTLFLSETRETNGRLTTTTVLFRQLDWHALQNFLVISLKCGEHDTSTIENDETELVIILQK